LTLLEIISFIISAPRKAKVEVKVKITLA